MIRSTAELKKIRRRFKQQGKTVVFTNGCFDLLHGGHARLLESAKSLGDILIIAVNSDGSVRRLKGKGRPIVALKHRLELVAALEAVDYAVPFSSDTPERLIIALRPDILVKGRDWPADEIAGRQFAGRVVRLRLVPGLSTTALIEKIRRSSPSPSPLPAMRGEGKKERSRLAKLPSGAPIVKMTPCKNKRHWFLSSRMG
ncbi:MAG: adenylyltransferase/cytidyltransferase family protein [Elusimicrobia bacterium]|nr:adenylyltransferase/cytidyltransferase family protein [Elusimicrobiota bacterium]